MHRIAATPGGWTPGMEGVMFVEQTPAPMVILTAADTEILAIAQAIAHLPDEFPNLRVANLLHLQQQLSIDTYADTVLRHAQVIVVRLLGGQAYWPYGLDVVRETVEQTGARLLVLPGDDRPDLGLMHQSTVPLAIANQLWRYFTEGGIDNMVQALQYLAQVGLDCPYHPLPPRPVPKVACYAWAGPSSTTARVGLLFYRAHYLSGNMAVIDGLCEAIARRGLEPMPMFVSSLRDMEVQTAIRQQWQRQPVDLVLNTTGFSLARLEAAEIDLDLWRSLDVPVLQVILSSGTREQWDSEWRGLLPRDVAMNVALPEVDGRIITRAVSFKARQDRHPQLETDVVRYEPMPDRLDFVADLADNWVRLRNTPRGDRRLALILANYPSRDGRLANGVGLDTPESVVQILQALANAGYDVQPLPASGQELMQWLTQGVTHDPDGWDLRPVRQSLSRSVYLDYWQTLPPEVQQGVGDRWSSPESLPAEIPIPGLQIGSVFIGIQPPRGYDLDPSLNYHAADLEPPHAYLAFYHWLRHDFGAQALVHVGKHGNLEWLPGKSVALSQTCYPEVASGALPHLYPFIVNDPGEGSQAKRRSQAVIIDHLTPPLTRAELYGPLQQLERLIDEYYEADSLDPSRLPVIRDRIQTLIQTTHLNQDLATLPGSPAAEFNDLLTRTDGYLCELKEAQIRDGLHILGQCPSGRLLRDLIIAIARSPDRHRLGLTRAIATAWELDCDPLSDDPATLLSESDRRRLAQQHCPHLRTVGDAVEQIEQAAAQQVDAILAGQPPSMTQAAIAPELTWIQTDLLPNLQNTRQELTALLHGLDGGYIPSGPSGAPTRGRADVLPTGRNFYSVDIRGIPTESAWAVGRNAAELLIERYTQEEGNYPRSLALSVWSTSTMRTGGDDLAEALALLGVRPVWDGPSRRVVDFEILPLEVLGRSRVDVTLRISGFFRDAFPNLIELFDQAVQAIAALDEPPEWNPLADQVQQETQAWIDQGLTADQASDRASYRIFGSKPGAYGAGLQGLIEAQNWSDDDDLARAYINWSSTAYTGGRNGRAPQALSAPAAFEQRLSQLQIVLHNQDNREHDLLDSDDYYQFQGGLTVAARSRGQSPKLYFGDHSRPETPKVRSLSEELTRVYRSRVVNPKWIAGVMRHGYKGAFEMAATVDYLFAYSATTHCVEDYMYQGVAEAYIFDDDVQQMVQDANPWALRDMAERLLEAHQRRLWSSPSPATLDRLRAVVNQAEGAIEQQSS
ncbi:cobaltochelatase subunit CobN [Leptolyngbya sp. CCY15150]|uniref:cobaltochelatase subunit CobN n=1 Tax=Leptolyngbya sp. CCY15150 TaxID=2767772 RepID=UPI00194E36DC|nr:cobaltochelatase subunit CobN [Leptolyngbya sp. CCY15150]